MALHQDTTGTLAKPPNWSPPQPLPAPIETERLVLRFYEASDADAMLAALNADRASLLPWLPWVSVDNRNVAECVYHIERFRRVRDEGTPEYAMGIFDRETFELVGGTGFHRVSADIGQAEIGYWIRGDRARRGLCTEAVAALISAGLTPKDRGGWGFRRITIVCAEPNAASRRVPEKLGLRLELRAKADRWIDGLGFVDTLGWGVTADEWDIDARRIRAQSGPHQAEGGGGAQRGSSARSPHQSEEHEGP
jgi:ribosomal-protein-serine acetyltransferase